MCKSTVLRCFINCIYDDFAVAGEGGRAVLSARVVRAWYVILGGDKFNSEMAQLEAGGVIRILSDFFDSGPEDPVIEILSYL